MSDKMTNMKNIHTDSEFNDRTGLIVRISNKKNAKRLMRFGLLHYVSSKMSYVLLYVDTKKLGETIEMIRKENYVTSVEISKVRDLPIEYEGILEELNKEISDEKKKEKRDIFQLD